jgi:hypothetical protein
LSVSGFAASFPLLKDSTIQKIKFIDGIKSIAEYHPDKLRSCRRLTVSDNSKNNIGKNIAKTKVFFRNIFSFISGFSAKTSENVVIMHRMVAVKYVWSEILP